MDFAFTESQAAVAELARKLFAERVTPAHLKVVEASPDRIDRALWRELASLGLLGIGIPEELGGTGQGLLELCALMEEAGAAVAPIPLWATCALGALPIARFGSEEQKRRWLPKIASGEWLISTALEAPAATPPLRAKKSGSGWELDGTKTCVPVAGFAERIFVPAETAGGSAVLFAIDPHARGVMLERQQATTGEWQWRMTLSAARAEETLGDETTLAWLLPRATVALTAMELGVAERALRMTAAYTAQRQQFDRPIATFQAVAQRAADAYVDVESIRVAVWQAAWRLEQGLPADEAVAIAKIFAAEAGHRVVYAAQHLHAGMGYDLDYPLHRYYLRSKQIELTLGSGADHLAHLGELIAG